jgi:two-component system, LytTR family, response regulator
MKVLVVDDEPLARTALGKLLALRSDVEKFEVAENAQQALAKLTAQPYDVMLLDIHMPGLSGFQLIERLSEQSGPKPSIIFITAYQDHAVEAFEKRAVDYILKPFVPARVHEALDMAARRSSQERAEWLLHALTELSAHAPNSTRVAIKDKDRIVFVDAAELISAEAHGNYVVLHQRTGSYLHRGTISGIAEKLKPYGFVRIHRSVLVNGAFVATIEPGVGSDYILRTRTGTEYHVTQTYRHNLQALARFWIGPEGFGPGKRSPRRADPE